MKSIGGFLIVLVVIWIVASSSDVPLNQPVDQSSGQTPKPLKIGFIGPFSEAEAFVGETTFAGAQIAVDEINTAGGVNGRMIELIAEDGKCKGAEAVTAANKLINIDRVEAIIGGLCSSETLAIAPIIEEAQIVLISPASTAPDVSFAGEYVFRTIASDSFQGTFAAKVSAETLGKGKVALLSCLSDYCIGVKDAFKEAFLEYGEVVADESYERDSKDIRSQLAKIKAAEPDLIYIASYTGGAITSIQQLNELGIEGVTLLGPESWNNTNIWSELGELGEGAIYTEPKNKDLPQSFTITMQARAQDITVWAPRAYDTVYILAAAFESGESLKDTLNTMEPYEGIADTYEFDENGDLVIALYDIKTILNGEAVMFEQETPEPPEPEEE